ncbi:methyltransferase domain-containing protein [Nocardioides sp.]|uniref:methyltransferase domain-containing protein n=1 Tax=Nocardioides sp. TaxID=35761 RepID=UPI003527BDC9
MHTWDPDRYLTYADERGRPFLDLLSRVGARSPRTVVDLGCGPGNLTELLAERWPGAEVAGLDASAEMIERARTSAGRVRYEVADLRGWSAPDGSVDVLVSNATLQWVPDHLDLLPRLYDAVAPGGWLAFQVPGNFGSPATRSGPTSPRSRRTPTTRGGRRAGQPRPRALSREPARPRCRRGCLGDDLSARADRGGPGVRLGLRHRRPADARGTARRAAAGLRGGVRRRLRAAYPSRAGRVVLPFRRVFVVAQRPEVGR